MVGYKLFCCSFLVYVNIFFLNGCAENIAVSNRFEASVAKPVQEDKLFITSVKDKHLKDVLSLVFKTDIGRSFEPEIKQLLRLDKIKLVAMSNGHFGESGEGCVIKQGRYFFEGFFIELNKFYSTSILATSLVHELAHYKIIKNIPKPVPIPLQAKIIPRYNQNLLIALPPLMYLLIQQHIPT